MADYDFSTLSSADLEGLVCDLLNADQGPTSVVKYKTFKDGKDKGIDILYASTANPYDHVGQVKHYYRSGFTKLLYDLRHTEVAKVRRLNPNQYIVATSVDLNVREMELIRDAFAPFLKTVKDIYGKKDLNRLLTAHGAVLGRHHKLWFSDVAVLRKILDSDLTYRANSFVENELTRRIRVYVESPVFEAAKSSLEENQLVVITGEPGVGKTTLAEMLVYHYLKEDYELLYTYDDIKDVERMLRDDDSKQVIYFDDFLGSNAVEINKAQGSETALISIVRRLRRCPNKRLIFTTRVHILNTAVDQSEKLKRSHIKAAEIVFNLQAYDRDLRTRLLLNHIDESEIDEDLKSVLHEEEIFKFIVDHQGFNPRSVEYITTKENLGEFSQEEYRAFIVENFNNPLEIWGHAYRNQIGMGERLLLNTLSTFDGPVERSLLEAAFDKRVRTDEKARQTLEINAFSTALSRLDKGFITIQRDKVNLINASLKDFLRQYLQNDPHEIGLMLKSVKYIHQLAGSLSIMALERKVGIPDSLISEILSNFEGFLRKGHRDHDLVRLAIFLSTRITHAKKEEVLIDVLYTISDWKALYEDYGLNKEFLKFLTFNKNDRRVQAVLRERTSEIVNDLFLGERNVFRAVDQLAELQETFDLDFGSYDATDIVRHLDGLFSEHISNEIEWLKDFMTYESEAREKEKEIKDLQERINKLGLRYKVDMSDFDEDWYEIAVDNDMRRLMEKDD